MTSADKLTPQEIQAAKDLGLSVTMCAICTLPTLYMLSPKKPIAPITCGRGPCLEKFGRMA